MTSILLALSSNVVFATASLYFTDFAKKISPAWMNYFKACVAFACFATGLVLLQAPLTLSPGSFTLLVISGWLGLMIGDIFILRAFTHLGAGRSLMIFGFQPLLLGVASFYFFGEDFSANRGLAILFLIGCLICFSMESFREKGHWDVAGLVFILTGIFLDAAGLLLTKKVFRENPDISIFLVNSIRSGATVIGFFAVSLVPLFKLKLLPPYRALVTFDKKMVVLASFLGTFLSLTFYMKAVQIGHLATVSAVVGASPLFATLFEIYKGRRKLTPYLVVAILCFLSGVGILILL